MANIGSLIAGIGLETDALQNDVRKVEQSFSELAASTKTILNGIESSIEPLRRETNAYAKEINQLAKEVERNQARLKVYQSDTGQTLLKQRAALQKDIDKLTPGFGEQGKAAGGLTAVMGGLSRSIIAVAASYFTLQGALRLTKFIIQEGTAAEKVWTNVASSLKLHGFEVERNVAEMKAFAAARQEATGIGDETIAQAQIRLLDANIDLADSFRLVAAAQDFAVAKDMDLVSAADLIGKSIDSDVNALGRYGIQIDKTLPKQEQINQLMNELGSRFGGRAAAAMETTAGKMALLSATTGDLAENLYTKLSPAFEDSLDSMLLFVKGLVNATATSSSLTASSRQALEEFDKQKVGITALLDEYDNLANKSNLSVTEQERLLKVIADIATFMPSAIIKWDTLNNAIEVNTQAVRDNLDVQQNILRRSNRENLNESIEEYAELGSSIKHATDEIKRFAEFSKTSSLPPGFDRDRITGKSDLAIANRNRDMRDQVAIVAELSEAYKLLGEDGSFAILENVKAFQADAKAVGLTADAISKLTDAIISFQEKRPKISKEEPGVLDDEQISRTLQAYDVLISSGKATSYQLSSIWGDYTDKHLQQLEKELSGIKTFDDEMRKTILGAAKAKLDDALIDAQKAIVDRAIAVYQPIIDSQKLTVAELDAIWGPYSKAQLKRIDLEAQKYPELGAAAEAAYRQAAEAALAAEKIERQGNIIQRQVDEYKKLLDSGSLTAATLERVWDKYTDKRTEGITLEMNELFKLELSIQDIILAVERMNKSLELQKLTLDTADFRKEFEDIQTLMQSPGISETQFESLAAKLREMIPEEAEIDIKLNFQGIAGVNNDMVKQIKEIEESLKIDAGLKQFRDQQIAGLEILLQSNRLTAAELEDVWSEYYGLQLEDLADLQAGWELSGLSEERVGQLTDDFTDKLKKQKDEIDAWGKSWEKWFAQLDEDSKKLAESMSNAFEDNFFRAMEGEFNSFRDFVKAIISDITRYMEQELARIAAQALTRGIFDIFGNAAPSAASQGSALGDYNIEPDVRAAEGGYFAKPTLAMIGEAGPEVVVPVSRMDDPTFWEGVGLGNRGRGGDNVIVHMTVVSPDLPAFKANQSQIMAELQVRAGQAFRRNR